MLVLQGFSAKAFFYSTLKAQLTERICLDQSVLNFFFQVRKFALLAEPDDVIALRNVQLDLPGVEPFQDAIKCRRINLFATQTI